MNFTNFRKIIDKNYSFKLLERSLDLKEIMLNYKNTAQKDFYLLDSYKKNQKKDYSIFDLYNMYDICNNNKNYLIDIFENINKYKNFYKDLISLKIDFECVLSGGALRDLFFNKGEQIKDIDLFFNIPSNSKNHKAFSIKNIKNSGLFDNTIIYEKYLKFNFIEKQQFIISLLSQKHNLNNKTKDEKDVFNSIHDSDAYGANDLGAHFLSLLSSPEIDSNKKIDFVFLNIPEMSIFSYIEQYFDLNNSKIVLPIFSNRLFPHKFFQIDNLENKIIFSKDFIDFAVNKHLVLNLNFKETPEQIKKSFEHLSRVLTKYKYNKLNYIDEKLKYNESIEQKKELCNTLLEKCILSTTIKEIKYENKKTSKI